MCMPGKYYNVKDTDLYVFSYFWSANIGNFYMALWYQVILGHRQMLYL